MDKIYDLLIIGGGPAGLAAAVYAGRAKMDTLVFEDPDTAGQVVNKADIPCYPGIRHTDRLTLIKEMRQHARDFGVEFADVRIDRVDFTGSRKKLFAGDKRYEARSVILAAGAPPKRIGFPGEEEYTGRGVSYSSVCDGEFFSGKDIFVVGGGTAAAQEALYLTRFGKSVTVIVRKKAFTCAKPLAEKVRTHPKIRVHFNTEIVDVQGDEQMKSITFMNKAAEKSFGYKPGEEDQTFGIFIFSGYEPATGLFAGQVRMDDSGFVLTDEEMNTSVPGVFAAGDLRPKSLRQIVTAASDGAIAATSAQRYVTGL